jgi:putative glycosyltransferase (TIGR04348 family)
VQVCGGGDVPDGDLLIAIHAFRSAQAVTDFRARHPGRPVVVLLAGTDVYRFQHSDPEPTLASMAAADRLVGLHDAVAADIPQRFRGKLRVILQSAAPLPWPWRPSRRHVDVCVAGHLRAEKDPLRAAVAARRLPVDSRVRIVHLGRAHDEEWAAAARAEMARNARYLWLGEVPRGEVRRRFARSHAMVISSVMEGGANVVSEALVAGLPVLASRIPGNTGLLGDDHPGLFAAGDDAALSALLLRVERDAAFVEALRARGAALAPRFAPAREGEHWARLLAELA